MNDGNIAGFGSNLLKSKEIIVIDENNVVFLSTEREWIYRAVLPLTTGFSSNLATLRKRGVRCL